jgi:hypothetical protein
MAIVMTCLREEKIPTRYFISLAEYYLAEFSSLWQTYCNSLHFNKTYFFTFQYAKVIDTSGFCS